MTLSDERVEKFLNRHFVSGWTNIDGKSYSGKSNTHLPTNAAEQMNNCAGHHNIQMVFMTNDGRVVHCLPGYWSPDHFLHEAELAVQLAKLYGAKGLSAAKRNDKYLDLHLMHALSHSPNLQHSSRLQGFDKKHVEKKGGDFVREDGFVRGLKTPDQVIHERMAGLPFVAFEDFEVESYVRDLGVKSYRHDYGIEKEGHAGPGKTVVRGGKNAGATTKAAAHDCKCGSSCRCANCSCAKR